MVSIAEITGSFRKARERIVAEKLAEKNKPVLLLEEAEKEKLAQRKKFVFPADKGEIKPIAEKKSAPKLIEVESVDLEPIEEIVPASNPVKDDLAQDENLPSAVGKLPITQENLAVEESPVVEEISSVVPDSSSEANTDKIIIDQEKERVVLDKENIQELGKNEISEPAVEARRAAIEELKEKMQETRIKWLKVMEEKRRSYSKLYNFFGSRFKDNDQNAFQNDADISFYRGEFDKALFEYKDAVLADAKIRGVSNKELGEILKFFEIGLKLDTISAETQLKIEAGSGNIKGPFTASQENSAWVLSSDGKGVLQLPGSDEVAGIKKDEPVVIKEEVVPPKERVVEVLTEEATAEEVAPAEIISEEIIPAEEKGSANFQESSEFDHYFISAMKDISLGNKSNWKEMRGKTYERANEDLKEDLFPGLMQNIVEAVQKYQKELGEEALPGGEETLNKWLGRVVKLSIERKLTTKI